MKGLRGALAARIPPALLRISARYLLAPRGRARHRWTALPDADAVRSGNLAALRSALAQAHVAFRQVRDHGEAILVARFSGSSQGNLRSTLEGFGLTVLDLREGPDQWNLRVSSRPLGILAVDRALAARLMVTPDGAVPALPHLLDVPVDIDVVYTWVDGNDPGWRQDHDNAVARQAGPLLHTSNDDGRFSSHDELRYSLRALEYFAPWVRRIHLVTSGQAPGWLDRSSDRVHVVSHAEIFAEPAHLPTFNSHAIEAQLHRVPGLAEHFIYMNDDVFLGQPSSPADFFTPAGQTRFFLSDKALRQNTDAPLPVDIAATNNRAIIEGQFGATVWQKFKHSPHPQLRSTLERIEREHPAAVRGTAAATFRSATDLSIPSSLAHYYGLALGTAVPSDIGYAYVDLANRDAHTRLLRLIRRGLPQTFCINEVEAPARPRRRRETARMLREFLERCYPVPSSFEMPRPTPSQPAENGSAPL